MKSLLTNISELVTVSARGGTSKTRDSMSDIHVIHDAAMLVSDVIEWTGNSSNFTEKLDASTMVIDCQNKAILPGFVDSHTHIVFAGSRSHEFARRLQGVSYQQIASEGGGILSTVKSVREASVEELFLHARHVALSALRHGTTTIEIKSGYGLSPESERKLLLAIEMLRSELPMDIHATFLGAHDFPPEYSGNREAYVDLLCNEMIPNISAEKLAEFCDVFADTGYYTLKQSERILRTASDFGMKLKVHADELTPFAAAELAADLKATSADHLLFISDSGIRALSDSGTVATLLPGTAYTLRLPYAPAQKMIEHGTIVALATDCNPGSCLCENMQVILSLACMNMKMSIEQAISASTLNGAAALGLAAVTGSLEVGKRADFIVLDSQHYADLVYHFGVNHVEQVWIRGKRVS